MNSLRKWLYRPKRADQSLLAQFYFSDEELNSIAAELDSFEARKDPERCTTLVNQLRACQARVLSIIFQMMDETVKDLRAPRDFRVKFPDDIMSENLAGQLWFGAECLAAGSSIMNREVESAAMRPLARALTKNLDRLRSILKEQCLRSVHEYTRLIKESLIIFDKLFAEFELSYVSAMVPVKTAHEYDMIQEITVLFSETVQRALRLGLLTQDTIDEYDPALMFTIPRLAIVSGVLVFTDGPLNPDNDPWNISEMFRPFQTLLIKIRELLSILSQSELQTLESALCSQAEPSFLASLEKEKASPLCVASVDADTSLVKSSKSKCEGDAQSVTRSEGDNTSVGSSELTALEIAERLEALAHNFEAARLARGDPASAPRDGHPTSDQGGQTSSSTAQGCQDSSSESDTSSTFSTSSLVSSSGSAADEVLMGDEGVGVEEEDLGVEGVVNIDESGVEAHLLGAGVNVNGETGAEKVVDSGVRVECEGKGEDVVKDMSEERFEEDSVPISEIETGSTTCPDAVSQSSKHSNTSVSQKSKFDSSSIVVPARRPSVPADNLQASGDVPASDCSSDAITACPLSALPASPPGAHSSLSLAHHNSIDSGLHSDLLSQSGSRNTIASADLQLTAATGCGSPVLSEDFSRCSVNETDNVVVAPCESESDVACVPAKVFGVDSERSPGGSSDITTSSLQVVAAASSSTLMEQSSANVCDNAEGGPISQCDDTSVCDNDDKVDLSLDSNGNLDIDSCAGRSVDSFKDSYSAAEMSNSECKSPSVEQEECFSECRSDPSENLESTTQCKYYDSKDSKSNVADTSNSCDSTDIAGPSKNCFECASTSLDSETSSNVVESQSTTERAHIKSNATITNTSSNIDIQHSHSNEIPKVKSKRGNRKKTTSSGSQQPAEGPSTSHHQEPPAPPQSGKKCDKPFQVLRTTEKLATNTRSSATENECPSSSETSSYTSDSTDGKDAAEVAEVKLAVQAAETASKAKVRAQFRSSNDMIHRLFVCISGVADQLQTNYAGDLRNILRAVFDMNCGDCGSGCDVEGEGDKGDDSTPLGAAYRAIRANRRSQRSNGIRQDPPLWLPDEETNECMSCQVPFTFVRRRHHCRNCGKIYCSRCSNNFVPLPHFGEDKPVRVCNRCFMFQVPLFTPRTPSFTS